MRLIQDSHGDAMEDLVKLRMAEEPEEQAPDDVAGLLKALLEQFQDLVTPRGDLMVRERVSASPT